MKRILILLLFLALPLDAAILKQSTAIEVVIWFADSTTGAPKTGITVTSETCRYIKSDMTTASFAPTASAGSNDQVEIGNGAYRQELTAAQLDTAGPFEINCSISGSVSPPTVYDIYPLGAYNVTIGGSPSTVDDFLETALSTVGSTNSWAYRLNNLDGALTTYGTPIRTGTAQAGATTTITLDSGASAVNNYYQWREIVLVSGTGSEQSAIITAYTGSTKVATILNTNKAGGTWHTTPDSTSVFKIIPYKR